MPASNNAFKIPLVDFSSFSSGGDTAAQVRAARDIDAANRLHGFVCLRNSGIPPGAVKSAFEASKLLFGMSGDAKAKLKQLEPRTNTGYARMGMESLNRKRGADLKEAFNVRAGSRGEDFAGTPPGFEGAARRVWDALRQLAGQYALCCALALGMEPDYFAGTLGEMDLCTLRMLHYPPCDPDPSPGASCAIRCGEHTDFGAFTFLLVSDFHDESSLGLQVKAVEGGEVGADTDLGAGWSDVVFDDEALRAMDGDETCAVIVNTGALMGRWTNDVWRATAHRVVAAPGACSSHRHSMAMFIDPDRSTVCSVHDRFLGAGETPKYPPISSFEYLMMKLSEAQGAAA